VGRYILLVILILLIAAAIWLYPAYRAIQRFAGLPIPPSQPFNILVAGTTPVYSGYHTRAQEAFPTGPTDTLFLVHVDPKANLLTIFSIPRDTMIELPGYGIQKINAAYPLLGPQGMVQTVEHFLGIPIQGYLLVDLSALRGFVNALGGIRVYVPEPMDYTDQAGDLHIHFNPGWHTLNGREAEEYIRFRHDLLGDIGRVMRTQGFLDAVLAKLRSPSTWPRFPEIAQILEEHTQTDLPRSTFGQLAGFLLFRHPMRASLLEPGYYCSQAGVSYWCPHPQQIANLVQSYLVHSPNMAPLPLSALSDRVIDVVNDTSTHGLAQAVGKRLSTLGLQAVYVLSDNSADPAVTNPEVTTIVANGDYGAALTIQKALGFGKAEISGTGVLGSTVTIHVGQDALKYLHP